MSADKRTLESEGILIALSASLAASGKGLHCSRWCNQQQAGRTQGPMTESLRHRLSLLTGSHMLQG